MRVVILGGHGKVAMRLLRLLVEHGHAGVGIVRNPDHVADLRELGAEAAVVDIEKEDIPVEVVADSDAVVMAAGAGPGSGPERKRTVDLGGALKLIDAAKRGGVRRYVMISSIGADDPPPGDDGMAPYLQAKAEADRALVASGLEYTIVRPVFLSDDPGTGRIEAAPKVAHDARIPRDDVAATLLAVLELDNTIGKTFEERQGETPIRDAIAAL